MSVETHATRPGTDDPSMQSPWPLLLTLTLLALAVTLLFWPQAAVVVVLVGAYVVYRWLRDLTHEHARDPPPYARGEGRLASFWTNRSKQEWAGYFFMGVLFASLVAALRAAQSHGLLVPALRPEGLRDLNSFVVMLTTLVAVASGAVAFVGNAAVTRERGDRVARTAGLAVGVAVVLLLGHVLELTLLARAGITPDAHPQVSALFALIILHAVFVTGGIAFFALVLARARNGRYAPRRDAAIAHASFQYWIFVTATWLVIYAVVFLGLLPLTEHLTA